MLHSVCVCGTAQLISAFSTGKGCLVYPNGDKYEGSWEGGKRHGMGILWLYDNGRHRVR